MPRPPDRPAGSPYGTPVRPHGPAPNPADSQPYRPSGGGPTPAGASGGPQASYGPPGGRDDTSDGSYGPSSGSAARPPYGRPGEPPNGAGNGQGDPGTRPGEQPYGPRPSPYGTGFAPRGAAPRPHAGPGGPGGGHTPPFAGPHDRPMPYGTPGGPPYDAPDPTQETRGDLSQVPAAAADDGARGGPEHAAADEPDGSGRRRSARPSRPAFAFLGVLRSLRPAGPGHRDGGTGAPGEPGAVSPAVYFVGAGVVLVVALIAVAGFVLLGGGGTPKNAGEGPGGAIGNGPVPSAYSMASSTKVFAPIADRRADPRPLTAHEVAGPKTIADADAKASLKLTTSNLGARCANAIWGGGLAAVLQRAGCTQASRTVYTDKRYAALVTIFNLSDAAGADRVVAAVDPRAGQGFPQSPSADVPFNEGFSTARGVAMGHYAVITWIRRADGSGDETDPGLVSLLVSIGPPPAVLNRVAEHGSDG